MKTEQTEKNKPSLYQELIAAGIDVGAPTRKQHNMSPTLKALIGVLTIFPILGIILYGLFLIHVGLLWIGIGLILWRVWDKAT